MKSWKQAERRVAELLGGCRIPVSGRARGHTADVGHECLAIEVKTRKRLPVWLEDALRQAEASAKEGRLPVAVLHEDGKRYADALVVLRAKNFAQYLTEFTVIDKKEDG